MILLTGGCGSLGQEIARLREVIILDNNEYALTEMAREHPQLRYIFKDIRDNLDDTFKGIDGVIHCAALKHVPICEDNPIEAVKTNVGGSINVAKACLHNGIKKVIGVSTDKAVYPINTYGATKLLMEKIFLNANFSCVRLGNFKESRGSVIPILRSQSDTGVVTITDIKMTRYWITLKDAARFTLKCLKAMSGGEIFLPKMVESGIIDLVKEIAPLAEIKEVGKRKGEKLHEDLYSENEVLVSRGGFYIIKGE